MKKLVYIASIICMILNVHSGMSQWLSEVPITTDPAGVQLGGRNVSARGNYVHAVWSDYRYAETEIYYRRSTNSGTTWEPEDRFTNHAGSSYLPEITTQASNVHVVWQDDRDGNNEIYYKRSTDDGVTWYAATRMTNNSDYSTEPSIDAAGQQVYIVWSDHRDGYYAIYFKNSTDGGANWSADTKISLGTISSQEPSVCAIGQAVYVTWEDSRFSNDEIFFRRSTDGGNNWGPETRLTNNSAQSNNSTICVLNQNVSVFWSDMRDGNYEIYYKRSTDGGILWSSDTRMTILGTDARHPSCSVSGQFLHLVWEQTFQVSKEIIYKRSTDGGLNWSTDFYVSPLAGSGFAYDPTVAVSGSVVHTTWRDSRNAEFNKMYYRENPNNGNPTAVTITSTEIPNGFLLTQNYPNPFNPSTKIDFSVPQKNNVTIRVFNSLGAEVSELVNETLEAGNYSVNFNAAGLSSGMYFYRLRAGTFTDTRKMVLIK